MSNESSSTTTGCIPETPQIPQDPIVNLVTSAAKGLANILIGNKEADLEKIKIENQRQFEQMLAAQTASAQQLQTTAFADVNKSRRTAMTDAMNQFELMNQSLLNQKSQTAEAQQNREERVVKDSQQELINLDSRQDKSIQDFKSFANLVEQQDKELFKDKFNKMAERTDQAERDAQQTVKELGEQAIVLTEQRNKEQLEMTEAMRVQMDKNSKEALEFISRKENAILAGQTDEQNHTIKMAALETWGAMSRASVATSYSLEYEERKVASVVKRIRTVESRVDAEMTGIRELMFYPLTIAERDKAIRIEGGKMSCERMKSSLEALRDDLYIANGDQRKEEIEQCLDRVRLTHQSIGNLETVLNNMSMFASQLSLFQSSVIENYKLLIESCGRITPMKVESHVLNALSRGIKMTMEEKLALTLSENQESQKEIQE